MAPPKFLAYLVDLCFQEQCPKQNIVAPLKSKDLVPQKFWAGYATAFNGPPYSTSGNRPEDRVLLMHPAARFVLRHLFVAL